MDLDLCRPALNGVYFVGAEDLERLAAAGAEAGLGVHRADLAGCAGKTGLLDRLAAALRVPAGFGHNWDALADVVRDLGWLPGRGHALLFAHAADLARAAPGDWRTLLGVLDDAATFFQELDLPWFAFLALPDEAFDAPHA